MSIGRAILIFSFLFLNTESSYAYRFDTYPNNQAEIPELVNKLSNKYNQINEIVHDPMFGLLSWKEFLSDVDLMIDYWEMYKCYSDDYIKDYRPSIKLDEHQKICNKIEECLIEFIQSLESGFQEDFSLPCDSLGLSIEELVNLYKHY